jgi:hypothetical protein
MLGAAMHIANCDRQSAIQQWFGIIPPISSLDPHVGSLLFYELRQDDSANLYPENLIYISDRRNKY